MCATLLLAGLAMPVAAVAQTGVQTGERTFRFDIPAGDLGTALKTFARISRQQVTFDSRLARARRVAGLRGTYSVRDAIDRLLDGSGLAADFRPSGLLIIRPAAAKVAGVAPDAAPGTANDIVVTGSLIPLSDSRLPTPVTTVTAADIRARGFTSVAQAIQQSPFSTGSVQGSDLGYTQGARTARLFGFGPGFTKYLLDGRPMGMFPALYGNTAAFVDLSSIPTQLVERVDILPGGQSSLYGSDAIAGVVNITLRKKLDHPMADVRIGLTDRGGGRSLRISGGDGFERGGLRVLVGGQYEAIDPIWGFERPLTATPFRGNPASPFVPGQAFALISTDDYTPLPIAESRCAGVTGLFGGSTAYTVTPTGGSYCGNANTGYTTLTNRERRLNLFGHAGYDLGGGASLYADVLYGRGRTAYTYAGAGTYYDSSLANLPFHTPGIGGSFSLTRTFSPEELGGLDALLSRQTTGSLFTSLGVTGGIGASPWRYDVNYVRNHQTLETRRRVMLAEPVEAYFRSIFGAPTGTYEDPLYGPIPSYTTDLSGFFAPVAASVMEGFRSTATSTASTNSDWGRGLVSNAHLFALPGGDAGFALAVESGREQWKYVPDTAYANGSLYGYERDVSGDGARTFVAGVGEIRLPVLPFATLSGSLRYDRYFVGDIKTGKASYNLAAEVRPLRQLMLRARYGTAFKAPTLADLFQGDSTQFAYGYDYYRCALIGVSRADCYIGGSYSIRLSGNPALRPITADVMNLGVVLTPVSQVEISLDYLKWRVRNGVAQENADTILRDESLCRTGSTGLDAARCAAVVGYVERDANGNLVSVYAPRVNVTRQEQSALVASLSASHGIGSFGRIDLSGSYTLMLTRRSQATPASAVVNLLENTLFNTDFRSRANASLGWSLDRLTTTVYVDRVGRSPNYTAASYGATAEGAAWLPSLTTVNLGLSYALTRRLRLDGNVTNLFDAGPPADDTYPGSMTGAYNSQNYGVIGRTYMLQLSAGF